MDDPLQLLTCICANEKKKKKEKKNSAKAQRSKEKMSSRLGLQQDAVAKPRVQDKKSGLLKVTVSHFQFPLSPGFLLLAASGNHDLFFCSHTRRMKTWTSTHN